MIINDGSEELQKTLGRAQAFNINTSGSDAYFIIRTKDLEVPMEQESMCTA